MNREKINIILRMSRTIEENELLDFLKESDKFIYEDYINNDIELYKKEKDKLIKLNTLLMNLEEDDLIEPIHIYNWFDVEDDSFKVGSIINKEKEVEILTNLLNIMYVIKNSVGLSIMSNVKMASLSSSTIFDFTNDNVDLEELDNKYLEKLNQVNINFSDNEDRHIEADMLLIQALAELGLVETAERFRRLADGFFYA